jgi:SSS family solute:Na+ symporter
MRPIDWIILFVTVSIFTGIATGTRKYARGVAGFLAANRCAGRYLLTVGDGMLGLGAISMVAMFQMYFEGGFTAIWWNSTLILIGIVMATSGWVIYRFRQTRVLTWAQFYEVRYSRRFRVFAGSLCFLAGIINFGIFPSVSARFMLYYCHLPETMSIFGWQASTYGVIMALMIALAVWYACIGGQIAILVTDFLQGLFCNIIFLALVVLLLVRFPWADMAHSLMDRPPSQSMVNPFKIQGLENYNGLYFLIQIWVIFYSAYSWQGAQGYNTSARDAHEAKMSKILGNVRPVAITLILFIFALSAYTFLNNPNFAGEAAAAHAYLGSIESDQIRSQMRVPVVFSQILPVGMIGLFCATIIMGFTSTVDTYLHSWGSILVQDIIMPLRKRRLTPKQHMRYLKLGIMAVGVFIWLFSYYFRQNSDIIMFFALSGMIYLCAQGAVTIGGLYWKRATTAGAWTSMILGLGVFAFAVACDQGWPSIAKYLIAHHAERWAWLVSYFPALNADKFPMTSVEIYFVGTILCLASYVVVSLLTCKEPFNLDRMLHRGEYALEESKTPEESRRLALKKGLNWKAVLGHSDDLTGGDRLILYLVYSFLGANFAAMVLIAFVHLSVGLSDEWWLSVWHVYLWINLVAMFAILVWFSIGGVFDFRDMFRRLRVAEIDELDDGTVVGHANLSDLQKEEATEDQVVQ